MPEIEDKFTIEPPSRLSKAMACLQPRNVPSRLTASTRRQSAYVGVLDGGEQHDACGIDQAVEPAVTALDRRRLPRANHPPSHVERMIDAGPAGEIGRNRNPAFALHRGGDGGADGARRPGDQHDLARETGHIRRRRKQDNGPNCLRDRAVAVRPSQAVYS